MTNQNLVVGWAEHSCDVPIQTFDGHDTDAPVGNHLPQLVQRERRVDVPAYLLPSLLVYIFGDVDALVDLSPLIPLGVIRGDQLVLGVVDPGDVAARRVRPPSHDVLRPQPTAAQYPLGVLALVPYGIPGRSVRHVESADHVLRQDVSILADGDVVDPAAIPHMGGIHPAVAGYAVRRDAVQTDVLPGVRIVAFHLLPPFSEDESTHG